MKRSGHVLLVVVTTMSVAVLAVTLFSTRYLSTLATRRGDDARTQALWLARSACEAGTRDARLVVKTAAGEAVLTRACDGVQVTLAGGTAEVTCATGAERYRAP
jgi:hypothetical protein